MFDAKIVVCMVGIAVFGNLFAGRRDSLDDRRYVPKGDRKDYGIEGILPRVPEYQDPKQAERRVQRALQAMRVTLLALAKGSEMNTGDDRRRRGEVSVNVSPDSLSLSPLTSGDSSSPESSGSHSPRRYMERTWSGKSIVLTPRDED